MAAVSQQVSQAPVGHGDEFDAGGLPYKGMMEAAKRKSQHYAACEMEVELGIALREQGYGVWQA